MPIDSEIMDGFWHSSCPNDSIDLSDMIRSLSSGANASLVAKIGTKKIISLMLIKSSPVDGFEVSKQVYQSAQHDRITCKLLGGQN